MPTIPAKPHGSPPQPRQPEKKDPVPDKSYTVDIGDSLEIPARQQTTTMHPLS